MGEVAKMRDWLITGAIAVLFVGAFVGAQTHHEGRGFDPTLQQCQVLATGAKDLNSLHRRPASDLNELDWRLSVCIGKFSPPVPTGVPLILDAHGVIADELRLRMEKAVETLPIEEQARFWAAFNADHGSSQ
jgi:hypothetical protein